MKRAIVIPDQHFPIHDEQAVGVTLKAIEYIKPDIFINLGDVGEWESVSAWRWRDKKQPPLEYQLPIIDEEIEAVNDGIDQFDTVLDKVGVQERHICEGNHDYWLNNFVTKYPYLRGYTFKNACYWDKRGYKFHSMNKPLRIGKLSFIHGAYATLNHAKKHAEIYWNLVYGHTHDVTSYAIGRLDGTVKSWSLGNLKDMSADKNEWLKGRIHNWQHAVGHITWFKDGLDLMLPADLNEIQEMTETDDYADNLNRIRELSRQVKILDLLDPTSRVVNILTEIVERSRHIPELEMVERKIMNIDNCEAEA